MYQNKANFKMTYFRDNLKIPSVLNKPGNRREVIKGHWYYITILYFDFKENGYTFSNSICLVLLLTIICFATFEKSEMSQN